MRRRGDRTGKYRRQFKAPAGLPAIVGLDGAVWTKIDCQGCDAPFWTDHASILYCSESCQRKSRHLRDKMDALKKNPWLPCPVCGEPYKSTRKARQPQTCSKSCSAKLRWQSYRAAKKAEAREP